MSEHHGHHSPQAGDKGLKQDAIGFLDGLGHKLLHLSQRTVLVVPGG